MKKTLSLIFLFLLTSICAMSQGSLLVANKNDNTVSFVSVAKGLELSKVDVGVGPHEVAVSPSGKLAAVANYGNKQGAGNSLTIIDVVKKEKIKDISLGEYVRPHGIEFINEDEVLVTSEAKQVVVRINIKTDAVSVVANTGQLVSHMVAWSPKDRMAYTANIASGSVSVIDVANNKLIKNIEVKKGIEGISVSPDGKEVWVANREDSTVIAIDPASSKIISTMPAHKVAYRIKFLPDGKHVVVSNGMSGNMSVYDVVKKKLIKDIDIKDPDFKPEGEDPNMPVPVGIAVSLDSKWIFVSTAGYGQVAVISTKDWKVKKRVKVGSGPDGIYFSNIE